MNTDTQHNVLEVNEEALLPLYSPWEAPNQHRQSINDDGDIRTEKVFGRRASQCPLPNTLRELVSTWRENDYEGASDTSRTLLKYWFSGEHILQDGEPFQYYFCQQEALETLIFLYEVKKSRTIKNLISQYNTAANAPLLAAGILPAENAWAKYAFKMATGSGKTKCMSIAIVWSYFHALRETGSDMTTRFLVIAPGVIVYERLLEDFGEGKIFRDDPLIPPEWKRDWHVNVISRNEPGAAATGVIYLTNIQQLYPKRTKRVEQYHKFMGPVERPTDAIDIGAELRERITREPRLMIINDEAHHVWHPDLAWNQAIQFFHDETEKQNGIGLVTQLDFTATPKDQRGNYFNHIVCDTPLGEAVDAGIVKVPIIGEGDLKIVAAENAAERYQDYLVLGYELWQHDQQRWKQAGKKPLLFVMCESTQAADEIARYLNTDPLFEDLNGKTLNLHTNLKGRIKKGEFIEDEKKMSDADLKVLRDLSRNLDSDKNPYACIVSVLMLREGWDVKNVTVIVPLRPFTAASEILPEQTLGRGLRRMIHASSREVKYERVVVIEHEAFRQLYEDALGIEGVTPIVISAEDVPPPTIDYIYPDKNEDLEIELPRISEAHSLDPVALNKITRQDVEARAADLPKLNLENPSTINYKGTHLLTEEIVERMQINRPLLSNGWTAISYFVRQLERSCRLSHILHPIIAPLLEYYITEILFDEKVSMGDSRLIRRLGDRDIHFHIHTVFEPLILDAVIQTDSREPIDDKPVQLSKWHPYPWTTTKRNPVIEAKKTLFNLVPCHWHFEKKFAQWLDIAPDVVAFAKNAGPEALRIDYLNNTGRIARYIPDFFVRVSDGNYYLVETKGAPDPNENFKAIAGQQWCQSAAATGVAWEYLFVHQDDWNRFQGHPTSFAVLVSAMRQSLLSFINEQSEHKPI